MSAPTLHLTEAQVAEADFPTLLAWTNGNLIYNSSSLLEHELAKRVDKAQREGVIDFWVPWLDFLVNHPEYFFSRFYVGDERVIEALRPTADNKLRQSLLLSAVDFFLGRKPCRDIAAVGRLIERMVQESPQTMVYCFHDSVAWQGPRGLPMAELIWALGNDEFSALLLPAIAYWHEPSLYRDPVTTKAHYPLVHDVIDSHPEHLLKLKAEQMALLMPILTSEQLNACLPLITQVIACGPSKLLHKTLVTRANELDVSTLANGGWAKNPDLNLFPTARDVLSGHDNPAVAPLIEQMLDTTQMDANSISQLETQLVELGARLPLVDAQELERVDVLLTSNNRIAKDVEKALTPALIELLTPFSELAIKGFWQLLFSAEEEVPQLVLRALHCLPESQQARLRTSVVEYWITADGDPKLRWILRLLQDSYDDSLVDTLLAIIHDWHKIRRPRAVMAIHHLASIGSPLALLRVQDLADNRRLTNSLIDGAHASLREVAERRQITVDDLYDELTPDFGLNGDLNLMIGDQSYQVILQGDLSLRVVNPNGKASKSVPKPRDTSLLPQWETAKAQLKSVNGHLKTVIKRQGPRMQAALIASKEWPRVRWQRLFVDHPLLQVLGQSLIWQGDDLHSFRIAEDLSLVDVNDETVNLADTANIRLWHPLHALDGERQQWQQYFSDYELTPIVEQLHAPSQLPDQTRLQLQKIAANAGLQIVQEKLAALLKKLGYRQGPVGNGPSVECHYLNLDSLALRLQINHRDYPPYMDGLLIEVEGICVYRQRDHYYGKPLNPSEQPPVLQAMLLDHLQQMEALAFVE
jgi:hypothetical protein